MQYNIIIEIHGGEKLSESEGNKNHNIVFEYNPRNTQKTKTQVRG